MKHITAAIFIVSLILGGCNNTKNITKKEDVIIGSWVTSGGVSGTNSISGEKTMTGTILSGINISGDYISIINSGNTILYDKTFGITVSKEYQNREYDLLFSPVSEYPIMFFGITDKNNMLSIRHFLLTDIQTNDSQKKSIKDICMPIYEEGINYKPKTVELKQGSQIYYLTYAKFSLMRFEPSEQKKYNYQAEICFIKNNKVYEITIGDPTHYRKNIVDSLTFL